MDKNESSPGFDKGITSFLEKQAAAGDGEPVVKPAPVKIAAEKPIVEEDIVDDAEKTPGSGDPLSFDFGNDIVESEDETPDPAKAAAPVAQEAEDPKSKSVKYWKGKAAEAEKREKELREQLQTAGGRKSPEEYAGALAELQLDPEYRAKFVERPVALFAHAEKVARSYEVDSEDLKKALPMKDFKQLNTYLRSIIEDEDARTAVRVAIQEIQHIYDARGQIDQKPFQYVNDIVQRKKAAEAEAQKQREQEFSENEEYGWDAGADLVAKKKTVFAELVDSETDAKWNEEVVKPTVQNARKVYNESLKDLRASGGRLTPELAARFGTLSRVYAVLGSKITRVQQLESENKRKDLEISRLKGSERPTPSSARGPAYSNGKAKEPVGIQNAAKNFLDERAK